MVRTKPNFVDAVHRGDIVLDVTLFGIKRGPAPPPTPQDLTPPADAVVTE